jgi:hypothetical protein
VTRDLYVGRVSEALGVGKDAIGREMAERPPRPTVPPAAGPTARRPAGPPRPSRRSSPERDLVRALLRDPELRPRLAEAVTDRSALREPEASLFAALVILPAETPPATLLETLEPEPRVLLARLLDDAVTPPDLTALVAGALDRLESRRLVAQLEELDRRLPLATADEQVTMAREKDRLSRKIAQLNPARWNVIRTGRGSAR